MKKIKQNEWRAITSAEVKAYKKAYISKLGRPLKAEKLKHVPISIKLDPLVLKKFKQRSKKTGIPYQTLINTALKDAA
jgi:uncharacterized protein (DUF4415 family)